MSSSCNPWAALTIRKKGKTMRRLATVVSLTILATIGGMAAANAAPADWVNVPGYVAPQTSGELAGTLISSVEIPTPATVKVSARTYLLTYEDGTGQTNQQILIVPTREYDGVRPIYDHAVPTDSLDPAKAPTKEIFAPNSSVDMSTPNAWLEGGGQVLITDTYGKENPEYAGLNNGVRMKNGMLAAQEFVGGNAPIVCGGFSGGGLDCGRVAEDDSVYVPNYRGTVIAGSPANMTNVIQDAGGNVQSGLISAAAMPGVLRSLPDEQKEMLDPKIRPGVKLAFQVLDLGGAGSSNSTLLGLIGIRPEWLMTEGSYDDPEVQEIFADAGLGQRTPSAPVAVVGNLNDPWMRWDRNGAWLADKYGQAGADVTQITTQSNTWPAHSTIDNTRQLQWMNEQLPEGSKLTNTVDEQELEAPTPLQVALAPVQSVVMNAAGDAINSIVPQISEAVDSIATDVLNQADATIVTPPQAAAVSIPEAPAVVTTAPVLSPSVDNVSTVTEVVKSQVGAEHAPIVDEIARQVNDNPHVADFINSLPAFQLPVG